MEYQLQATFPTVLLFLPVMVIIVLGGWWFLKQEMAADERRGKIIDGIINRGPMWVEERIYPDHSDIVCPHCGHSLKKSDGAPS